MDQTEFWNEMTTLNNELPELKLYETIHEIMLKYLGVFVTGNDNHLINVLCLILNELENRKITSKVRKCIIDLCLESIVAYLHQTDKYDTGLMNFAVMYHILNMKDYKNAKYDIETVFCKIIVSWYDKTHEKKTISDEQYLECWKLLELSQVSLDTIFSTMKSKFYSKFGSVIGLQISEALSKHYYGEISEKSRRKLYYDFGDEGELTVGTYLDVLDTTKQWYVAKIIDIRSHDVILGSKRYHITYSGWESTYNEWITLIALRMAPRGTHTNGRIHEEVGKCRCNKCSEKHSCSCNLCPKKSSRRTIGMQHMTASAVPIGPIMFV